MLETKTIGFIGAGNMATAIIGGLTTSGLVSPSQVLVSNRTHAKALALQEKYGVQALADNGAVAKAADILILAVKPFQYPQVIQENKDQIRPETLVVSIAAGPTIAQIEAMFGRSVKLARTMPNTPSLVGEGMTAIIPNANLCDVETSAIQAIFNSCGKTEIIPESLMDSCIAVSGSSPAYVYLFIEAMADAAVLQGMPRQQAYRFASQAVLGAAKMVLETGSHPGALKDAVCSPGGTTIEAVAALEQNGFRASVINAMNACAEKSRAMAKKEDKS